MSRMQRQTPGHLLLLESKFNFSRFGDQNQLTRSDSNFNRLIGLRRNAAIRLPVKVFLGWGPNKQLYIPSKPLSQFPVTALKVQVLLSSLFARAPDPPPHSHNPRLLPPLALATGNNFEQTERLPPVSKQLSSSCLSFIQMSLIDPLLRHHIHP